MLYTCLLSSWSFVGDVPRGAPLIGPVSKLERNEVN